MTSKFQWLEFLTGVVVGAALIFIVITFVLDGSTTSSYYKQGQIDALTGKVHYELVTKNDSTKTWEYKEEK